MKFVKIQDKNIEYRYYVPQAGLGMKNATRGNPWCESGLTATRRCDSLRGIGRWFQVG
jgi:hypothetical protein